MAEDKQSGTGRARRRGKNAAKPRSDKRLKALTKQPLRVNPEESQAALREGELRLTSFAFVPYGLNQKTQTINIWHFSIETDVSGAEAEQMFETLIRKCTDAMSEAHEQIERNRNEVDRLGEETRYLLSKLKAV